MSHIIKGWYLRIDRNLGKDIELPLVTNNADMICIVKNKNDYSIYFNKKFEFYWTDNR